MTNIIIYHQIINFTQLKFNSLLKKDKIKFLVFAILASILITALILFGKESIIMKYVSGFCLISWLITMFIINKKFK